MKEKIKMKRKENNKILYETVDMLQAIENYKYDLQTQLSKCHNLEKARKLAEEIVRCNDQIETLKTILKQSNLTIESI
jgi:hypothetical protein